MKHKKLVYMVVGIIVFFIVGSLLAEKVGGNSLLSKPQKSRYELRVERWGKENSALEKGGVVFLGDSITESFKIEKNFQDVYTINRGISGDTTERVLNRMDTSVYDLDPAKVFLMIGTNDLGKGKSPEEVIGNIQEIVEGIQENNPTTKVFIQSVYPVHMMDSPNFEKFQTGMRTNSDINKINAELAKYCQENDFTYIDVYGELLDESDMLALDYTVDGLHLSEQGYARVVEILNPYVYN